MLNRNQFSKFKFFMKKVLLKVICFILNSGKRIKKTSKINVVKKIFGVGLIFFISSIIPIMQQAKDKSSILINKIFFM